MAIYHPTTRQAIADVVVGCRVETGSLAATTYLVHTAGQNELYNIYGTILLTQLYLEVETAISSHAVQVLFNCTFTTPTLSANAMCAKCDSLADAARGLRVVHVGGVVLTQAIITDSAGLSDLSMGTPQILGGRDFVGTLGMLASDATATSGALRAHLAYVPLDAGGRVEAAV